MDCAAVQVKTLWLHARLSFHILLPEVGSSTNEPVRDHDEVAERLGRVKDGSLVLLHPHREDQ